MIATVDAPTWPARVIAIRSEAQVLRWAASEYRHRGIAIHSDFGAVDALLELSKEPTSVILVPSDLADLPLLEFVELAVSLGKASVLVGRAEGADERMIARCLDAGAHGPIDLPVTPERLADVVRGLTLANSVGASVLHCGPFSLDRGQHRAYFRGQELHLTLGEFALLEQLMHIHPRIADAGELSLRLDGVTLAGGSHIRVMIRRLRGKLAPVAQSSAIETVRGVGYRLTA